MIVLAVAFVLRMQIFVMTVLVIARIRPLNQRAKRVKKISIVKFKRKIIANPQSRYNICLSNVPVTTLALSFDEIFPNRILIPTNKLTKEVNLTLKNITFRQIVISTRLKLKS